MTNTSSSSSTELANQAAAVKQAAEEAIDREIFSQVEAAVRAAEEKKAMDMTVLRLAEITSFTDFFVICSGASTRQVQAIADAVIEQLKRLGLRPMNTEGYANAEWVLIDFGTFVVHVFTEASRRFYDLERLWRDAERVEL
jgi:ribosome-associated protein